MTKHVDTTKEKIEITIEVAKTWAELVSPETPCDGNCHTDTNPAHNALHALEHLCQCLEHMTLEEQNKLFEQEKGMKRYLSLFSFIKPFLKSEPKA